MTEEFESPLDKILREAREQGAFEDLPGKGAPIRWEDESQVPEETRMAHRVLKNNNFTLDWIAMGQELDTEYQTARQALEQARGAYRAGRLAARDWQAAADAYRARIQALNKRVIGYNLRVPHEQFTKRPYSTDPEA